MQTLPFGKWCCGAGNQSKQVIQHLGCLRQDSASTPKPRGTDAELLKQDDAPRFDPGSDSVQAGVVIALGAESWRSSKLLAAR